MIPPILLTDRLRLDGHRADDLEALAAVWQQPAVYAHVGDGRPRIREEVWVRLLRSVGHWTLLGYGAWIVRDRASGALLGEIGLLEARREIEPALDAPELSWLLAPEAQGRGIAREGLAAVLGWADAQGIARTVCIIDPANAASIRLAAHAGFGQTGTATYRDRPVNLYARAAA